MFYIVERLRLFNGATELNYESASITKTNDHIVNTGKARIEADSNINTTSTIDFKKADGSTLIFSTKVRKKKQLDMWELNLFTNGYELMNVRVENVYENLSPEAIVQDVVDNNTSTLTFVSGPSSGVTIAKYIAKAYGIDIIRDMMDTLQWQLRIDQNDNVFFEPKGNINNGVTFTNGSNIQITAWEEDEEDELFNRLRVKGGFESFNTQETGTSAAGTAFPLLKKPSGSVKVTTTGDVEVDPSLYTVDAENKQIIFDSVTASPTFDYSYDKPIIVDNQNDASIADRQEIFEELNLPFFDSFADARRYNQSLLDVFSTPAVKVKGFQPIINTDVDVGEQVTVVDDVRSKNQQLVIQEIKYIAEDNKTEYSFGSRDFVFFDWQRNVQERIKKIERQFINEDDIIFTRIFKHIMNVDLTQTTKCLINCPNNTFILDHQTLGRLRTRVGSTAFNFEADCSDTGNDGEWSGSNIDGDQFDLSGWRLSQGQFNGTDNSIAVTSSPTLDLDSDFSIGLAVKVTALPGASKPLINKTDALDGYEVNINASNEVELKFRNTGTVNTLSTGSAVPVNDFQHVVFTKDSALISAYLNGSLIVTSIPTINTGVNTAKATMGSGNADFFQGFLDEIRIYTAAISSANVTNINNKINVTDKMALYLSMDNPHLDDRSTTSVIHRGTDKFEFNLASTAIADSSSTTSIDKTNERLRLSSSSDKLRAYNAMFLSNKFDCGKNNIESFRFDATENKFGNDVIKYFLSADGKSNWDEVQLGVTATPTNTGNKPFVRIVMIGSGAKDTYITSPILTLKRTS